MKQYRKQVGVDRDYPGSCGWPRYEYKCPTCKKVHPIHGDISQTDDDGDKALAAWPAVEA